MSQKSQEKITAALLSLMESSPFMEITVSEICSWSKVARRTFYNNFDSKEDVLRVASCGIIDEFITTPTPSSDIWLEELATNYLILGRKHQDFFRLLIQQKLYHIYTMELHKAVQSNHFGLYKKVSARVPEELLQYIIPSSTASILKFYEIWQENGFQETPEQLAKLYASTLGYSHLTTKML